MTIGAPRAGSLETALVVVCCVATLLAVFMFPVFPSQDGGAHAYSAWALHRLHDGAPLFQRYFRETSPQTNWAATTIMAGLLQVVRPQAVERGFVVIYAVLAIATILFTTTRLFRAPLGAAALFFPLVFSYMLHMGSFNVALASIAFLPFIGLCYRYIERPSWRGAALVGGMLLLIFTLHVQIVLLALVYTGSCVLWLGFQVIRHRPAFRLRDAAVLTIASLPAIAMCLMFALQSGTMETHAYHPAIGKKLLHLVRLNGIASYSLAGLAVCRCMFAVLAGTSIYLAIRKDRQSRTAADGTACVGAAAIAVAAVYLAVPDGFDDAFNAEERTMIPMLAACLSWLVLRLQACDRSWALAMTGLVFALALASDRIHAFAAFAPLWAEYREVSAALPDGSAVILVDLDRVADHRNTRSIEHPFEAAPRFDAARNLLGSVLTGREVIFASLYEAAANKPYFALKYQPWLAAIVADRSMDELAARQGTEFDAFAKALRQAPAPVMYLAVWHYYPQSEQDARAAPFLKSVDENYQRVFTSSSGHMTLYKSDIKN